MKMLGLNPMEQDIMDLCNTVPRNGLIYFPDFCKIVLKRWREENEVVFRQGMFKVSHLTSSISGPLSSHNCNVDKDIVWDGTFPRAVPS